MTLQINNLDPFWMPFTAQRSFKKDPRLVVSAKGMYYTGVQGEQILDGSAGLWCVNAGHAVPRIQDAIKKQADELDYAPSFSYGHPIAFEAASTLCEAMPWDFSNVFFSNSGSEAVDTALKIALGYHRAKGQPQRTVLIGRERAYHGCGFGGISVGGIYYNRKAFRGNLLPNVDHLPHTHNIEKNAFSKGQPKYGAELADTLENIITLHAAENVAAVIIEPVSGSTGVLPPPKGYLERIRQICDKHGILLIFDEVITGFGRMGSITASEHFGVKPDIITMAKGLTNGAVPMGATFVRKHVYDAFMTGPEDAMEFMHGYTYSGHPLACAAAIATLEEHKAEGHFENAKNLMGYFQEAAHSLRDVKHVADIRDAGIIAAIELIDEPGRNPSRFFEAFTTCFKKGLMLRPTSTNTLAVSPPLCLEKKHIDDMFGIIRDVLTKMK